MAASLKLLPGSTVLWPARRYLIVDYESLDAIIARQPGKRRLERIPVNEAAPDHASHIVSAWTPDLASVPEAVVEEVNLQCFKSVPEAVVEEVNLQCFNSKIKGKPAPRTIRARVSVLSDRLKLEKREGRKRAAEQYEPLKGHFPGADCPLAVAQIDHTPMDVIVVDEEHRQPIQRPSLTVVVDVY